MTSDKKKQDNPKKRNIKLHPENLKPFRDSETAREMGRKGGLAKSAKEKERKIMSATYADFFVKRFGSTTINGKKVNITGTDIILSMMKTVFLRGDAVSVALAHEIGVLLEGQNLNVNGVLANFNLDDPENAAERALFAKELKSIYNLDFK